MITYQREQIADALPEMEPLIALHWEEIAHYKDIPLEPDFDFYRAMEKAGALRIFTARQDGRLIGYAVHFVRKAVHYRNSLQSVQDILFVDPAYRGGSAGPRLIQFSDEALRDEGVQAVYQHTKAAHDFGPLLKRLGYELIDLIYAKRLDHGRDSSSSV